MFRSKKIIKKSMNYWVKQKLSLYVGLPVIDCVFDSAKRDVEILFKTFNDLYIDEIDLTSIKFEFEYTEIPEKDQIIESFDYKINYKWLN